MEVLLVGLMPEVVCRRRRIIDDMRLEETRTESDSTWYHEGPDSLRVAREWIAEFSIPRAKELCNNIYEANS